MAKSRNFYIPYNETLTSKKGIAMLRKNKHVYTCPDVIHIMNRRKRNNRIAIGVWVATLLGSTIYGYHLDKQVLDEPTSDDPFDTIPKD